MTTGETGIFRVARDLYLMIDWIADAKRITQTQVAERYLRNLIVTTFLRFRNEIKQRKSAEDEKAMEEGVQPLPLPRVKVHLPIPLRRHEFHSQLDQEGPEWEWADEMSDERVDEAIEYEGSFKNREEMDDYVYFEVVIEETQAPPNPRSPRGKSITAAEAAAYESMAEIETAKQGDSHEVIDPKIETEHKRAGQKKGQAKSKEERESPGKRPKK